MQHKADGSIRDVLIVSVVAMSLAILAYLISVRFEFIDPLFMSLLLGMAVRAAVGGERLNYEAITTLVRFTIPAGIVLYSAKIPLYTFGMASVNRIVEIIWVMALYFLIIFTLGVKFGMGRRLTALIATGSAVCGASAIAILSPLIRARKEEASIAIMTITAVGLTGAMIAPILKDVLHLNPESYAFLAGATLHQTGLVKIASSYGGVEESALAFKGIRISMIAAAAVAVPWLLRGKPSFPLFIPPFLALSVLFSFVEPLKPVAMLLSPFATFAFSVALACIGLSIHMGSLETARLRYLHTAYAGWVVVTLLVLLGEVG